ncbi:MAG: hypothetical protein KatS3mg090_0884 [Patescibacteria group bacterium]|nr:MAG: hypothetical protein KatS3mg090_0884 [Patescibacteria group bacterium]
MNDNYVLFDNNNPSGPVTINKGDKKYKVWVDRDLCIGAGTCVAVAVKTFALDSEMKAVVINTAEEENFDTIVEAARACPVTAIFIEDDQGNKIFPS